MDDYANSYDQAGKWCRQQVIKKPMVALFYDVKLFHKALKETSKALNFPLQSLQSLIRTTHLKVLKLATTTVKSDISFHLEHYCNGDSILKIAKSAAFPPFLMARLLVDELTVYMGRKELAKIMREPRCLTKDLILKKFQHSENLNIAMFSNQPLETRLSLEVQEAVRSDPLYGPDHDRARHSIGVEYEVALERALKIMDIPFETESQLREKGSARTPDVLLKTPVAFRDTSGEWKVVCWIDSKAMFGDVETHGRTVLPQCETYIHRFGPGMIVYWFGHAPIDQLNCANGEISVAGWYLPEALMMPTGENALLEP
ncbi:unnamed protein product [Cylindrotheca closterium]|uniref:CDAN1-interacting nuclease 1 n=1 Tax=Cylindrotheca closterium TaxID=2856 RepID=A0AAD2CLC0_9STRA|nr:unnamed protein product [Cylindrotheca closterium]